MTTHRDLMVWQKGIQFVKTVYRVTSVFPREEMFGLTQQIRRAAVSVPSNIAEGAARKGAIEFSRFLYVARASLSEVDTQLVIAKELQYTNETLRPEIDVLFKLINGLIRSLKAEK